MNPLNYKELLLKEKERVLSSVIEKSSTETEGSAQGDDIDRAAQINDNHMAQRFMQRDRSYLLKIEKALAKIEEGTYGQCEECEEIIQEKRLMIRPTTTFCIGCKEGQEHKERTYNVRG
jgi:DnaK suppressor protein